MKKNKTSFTMSLILLAVSVIFTLLVAFVGKAPVGPENSEVGFAALNAALHDQFGYNTVFYGISSVLGYLTILTALINCVSFLVNLVKKKDLRMVRADLTATLGIYILLAVLYLVFEFVVINYRPVILEEGLEAFAGCAVVISHDRWFLDRICTHILAFEGRDPLLLRCPLVHRHPGRCSVRPLPDLPLCPPAGNDPGRSAQDHRGKEAACRQQNRNPFTMISA